MKKNTLILYSTTDGQTIIICEKIMSVLEQKSTVDILPLSEIENLNVRSYNQIIVGASIRYGKHKPELYKFVNLYKDELQSMKTGFFNVNVVARKTNKNSPETNPYMKKFLTNSVWKPNNLAVFAGKLNYPKYNFIDKQMIRLIMLITKGPTNTKEVFEFTDWHQVELFAQEFL